MTDHAPLTDEELTELSMLYSEENDQYRPGSEVGHTVRRLIADLRAGQAEVERLQAKVLRLQAENDQLEKWIPSGW